MFAWRDGDQFIVEFDLPGTNANSLKLDVERNVLTVRAERPDFDADREMVSAERRAQSSADRSFWAPS
jgi:HSP20 family protein